MDRRAQECEAGLSSFADRRRRAAATRRAEPARKAARMTMSVFAVEDAWLLMVAFYLGQWTQAISSGNGRIVIADMRVRRFNASRSGLLE